MASGVCGSPVQEGCGQRLQEFARTEALVMCRISLRVQRWDCMEEGVEAQGTGQTCCGG